MGKTIAVIGVGPGVGLAVAERFGREGFTVALFARRADKLDEYVARLAEQGIEAHAYPADVSDRDGLLAALRTAKAELGPFDVIEYSPTPGPGTLATPRNITLDNVAIHLDTSILGPIAVVNEVLPEMLAAGDGALLFCTAASAMHPVSFSANFAIAAGGLRNYVRALYADVKKDGVYVGLVAIAGFVVTLDEHGNPTHATPPGLSTMTREEVADLFWELYTQRDRPEAVIGDLDPVLAMIAAQTAS
jgi:short-subunit dehydrogenase